MKKFVLYSKVRGVFIGHAMGFAFWSKWEGAGQAAVPVFDSEQEVSDFITLHFKVESEPWYPEAIAVEVVNPEEATIAECVAAGLPTWEA